MCKCLKSANLFKQRHKRKKQRQLKEWKQAYNVFRPIQGDPKSKPLPNYQKNIVLRPKSY